MILRLMRRLLPMILCWRVILLPAFGQVKTPPFSAGSLPHVGATYKANFNGICAPSCCQISKGSEAVCVSHLCPIDTIYALTPRNIKNVILFANGNRIAYAPPLSCLSTAPICGSAPTSDHQRTSALIAATTGIDNEAEEQTLGIVTQIQTGVKRNWSAKAVFSAGANINANNEVYRTASTCRTGNLAPSGRRSIVDGSCVWTWINDSAISTKLSEYIETAVNGGAGFSEGLVTNMGLQDASHATTGIGFDIKQGAIGVEHDFANNSGSDAAPGVSDLIGMSLAVSGANKSLTALQLDGGNGSHSGANDATFWGLRLVNRLASELSIDIADDAKSAIGIGVDGFGKVNRTGASIRDGSTAPVSYSIEGEFVNGIAFSGKFKSAQVAGHGWNVDPQGGLNVYQARLLPDPAHQFSIIYEKRNDRTVMQSTHNGVGSTTLVLNPEGGLVRAGASGFAEPLKTPASSRASCSTGQFTDDANYHYVCVATNRWRRVALSDF